MTLESGTRLGTYRVESLLGRGGMGGAYLATDTRLDRRVALKVLAVTSLKTLASASDSSPSRRCPPPLIQ